MQSQSCQPFGSVEPSTQPSPGPLQNHRLANMRGGETQGGDSASVIVTAVTAVLFSQFLKRLFLGAYGFTKQSYCSQWYDCPDRATPAALGTVKVRGSACEGELGRNSSNVGHVDPQGNALYQKLVGKVSPWRLPRCVHGGQTEYRL